MTPWILAVLALFFVQTFLPSMTRARTGDDAQRDFLRSQRDVRPPTPVLTGRMERALRNMLEALPIFLPLALLAEMQAAPAGITVIGAAVFFVARVIYVPAYGSGIVWFRSAVWTVGHAGLVMMIIGVLGGA